MGSRRLPAATGECQGQANCPAPARKPPNPANRRSHHDEGGCEQRTRRPALEERHLRRADEVHHQILGDRAEHEPSALEHGANSGVFAPTTYRTAKQRMSNTELSGPAMKLFERVRPTVWAFHVLRIHVVERQTELGQVGEQVLGQICTGSIGRNGEESHHDREDVSNVAAGAILSTLLMPAVRRPSNTPASSTLNPSREGRCHTSSRCRPRCAPRFRHRLAQRGGVVTVPHEPDGVRHAGKPQPPAVLGRDSFAKTSQVRLRRPAARRPSPDVDAGEHRTASTPTCPHTAAGCPAVAGEYHRMNPVRARASIAAALLLRPRKPTKPMRIMSACPPPEAPAPDLGFARHRPSAALGVVPRKVSWRVPASASGQDAPEHLDARRSEDLVHRALHDQAAPTSRPRQ